MYQISVHIRADRRAREATPSNIISILTFFSPLRSSLSVYLAAVESQKA
jgi:hypothetical protein